MRNTCKSTFGALVTALLTIMALSCLPGCDLGGAADGGAGGGNAASAGDNDPFVGDQSVPTTAPSATAPTGNSVATPTPVPTTSATPTPSIATPTPTPTSAPTPVITPVAPAAAPSTTPVATPSSTPAPTPTPTTTPTPRSTIAGAWTEFTARGLPDNVLVNVYQSGNAVTLVYGGSGIGTYTATFVSTYSLSGIGLTAKVDATYDTITWSNGIVWKVFTPPNLSQTTWQVTDASDQVKNETITFTQSVSGTQITALFSTDATMTLFFTSPTAAYLGGNLGTLSPDESTINWDSGATWTQLNP